MSTQVFISSGTDGQWWNSQFHPISSAILWCPLQLGMSEHEYWRSNIVHLAEVERETD